MTGPVLLADAEQVVWLALWWVMPVKMLVPLTEEKMSLAKWEGKQGGSCRQASQGT